MIANMERNPWTRLSDIVYARMDYLGLTQAEVEAKGGPTGATVRKLKAGSGKPSSRYARSLRSLSTALGWDENTAWSLLTDDRSGWSKASLDTEEHELVTAPTVREAPEVSRPARLVRALTRMFQSDDPIPGLSDAELDELLEAIEARRPRSQESDGQGRASNQ